MQNLNPRLRRHGEQADKRRASVAVLVFGLAAAGLTSLACASDPAPSETGCDIQAIFAGDGTASCAFNICHGDHPTMPSLPPQADLNLLSPTLETEIINRPATYDGVDAMDLPNCPDPPELLIDTANPMESLMIKKLNGMHSCGEPMPNLEGLPFTDADRQCLIDWAMGLATGMP